MACGRGNGLGSSPNDLTAWANVVSNLSKSAFWLWLQWFLSTSDIRVSVNNKLWYLVFMLWSDLFAKVRPYIVDAGFKLQSQLLYSSMCTLAQL